MYVNSINGLGRRSRRNTFVISEIGIAHLGDMNVAKEMVQASAIAGVDAVKLQYYRWQDIAEEFNDKDVLDQVKQSQLNLRQLAKLRDMARNSGLQFACTPFKNRQRLAELARYKPDIVKIRFKDGPNSSPDGIGLVGPAIDSRNVKKVYSSVLIAPFDKMGIMYHPKITWLFCLPAYPPRPEDFHPAQSTGFKGFSDHYPNITASMLAAAITRYDFYVIEKHVRFPYQTDVPDAPVSIDFGDLGGLVRHLRLYEKLKPENKFWFPTIPPAPKRRQPKPA